MITKVLKANTPANNLAYAKLTDADNSNEHILNALEWHWVNGNAPMSTPYWADKVGHANLDNFIYALSQAGWVVSRANARAKWGEFSLSQPRIDKYFTREEQIEYKRKLRGSSAKYP